MTKERPPFIIYGFYLDFINFFTDLMPVNHKVKGSGKLSAFSAIISLVDKSLKGADCILNSKIFDEIRDKIVCVNVPAH